MLPVPARDAASLEDSVTSPDHRGQGIAPAAWERVADSLADRGIPAMLTTVRADNTPTLKALKKVGFTPYAAVRYTRFGRTGASRCGAARAPTASTCAG